MFNYCILPSCTIADYESETELVVYSVQADGLLWHADTRGEALAMVREFLAQGIMSRMIEERAYWTKRAYALHVDGHVTYSYSLVWKQVN